MALEHLIHAIVKQAAEDYKDALQHDDENYARSLKKWFKSEWGSSLCYGHEDYIMETIEEEVKNEKIEKAV